MTESSNPQTDSQGLHVPVHTSVCLRFFDEACEEELHRGIVISSHGESFTVQMLEVITIPIQPGAEFYYRDEAHQFVQMMANLVDSRVEDDRTVLNMALVADQRKYAEQRDSYRVHVSDEMLSIVIDGGPGYRALDVSAEGLGVVSARKLAVGQQVRALIEFNGQSIDGAMDVCTVRDRKDGKYRCGLKPLGDNPELLKMLQNIAMSIQRGLLSRLSSIDKHAKNLRSGDRTLRDSATESLLSSGASKKQEANDEPMVSLPLKGLVGQALAGNLLDHQGKVVIAKGDILTEETAASIANDQLFFGGDWVTAIAQMSGNQDEEIEGDERRRTIRKAWNAKMKIELSIQGYASKLETVALDLSRGGCSFLSKYNVPVGTSVVADVAVGDQSLKVQGTVQNCQQLSPSEHRVGVKFSSKPAAEAQTKKKAPRRKAS